MGSGGREGLVLYPQPSNHIFHAVRRVPLRLALLGFVGHCFLGHGLYGVFQDCLGDVFYRLHRKHTHVA